MDQWTSEWNNEWTNGPNGGANEWTTLVRGDAGHRGGDDDADEKQAESLQHVSGERMIAVDQVEGAGRGWGLRGDELCI